MSNPSEFMIPLLKLKELNSRLNPSASLHKISSFILPINKLIISNAFKKLKKDNGSSKFNTPLRNSSCIFSDNRRISSITHLNQSPFSEEILTKTHEQWHPKKQKFEQSLRMLKRVLEKSPEPMIFKHKFSDFLYFELALSQISRVFRGLKMKSVIWAWNHLSQREIMQKMLQANLIELNKEKKEKKKQMKCFYEWKIERVLRISNAKVLKACISTLDSKIKILMMAGFGKIISWNILKTENRTRKVLYSLIKVDEMFKKLKRDTLTKFKTHSKHKAFFERKVLCFNIIFEKTKRGMKQFAFSKIFASNYQQISLEVKRSKGEKLNRYAFCIKKLNHLEKSRSQRDKASAFKNLQSVSCKKLAVSKLCKQIFKMNYIIKRDILFKFQTQMLFKKNVETSSLNQKNEVHFEISSKNYIVQGYAFFIMLTKLHQKIQFINYSFFFSKLKENASFIHNKKREKDQKTLLGLIKLNDFFKKKLEKKDFLPFFLKLKENSSKNKDYFKIKTDKNIHKTFQEKTLSHKLDPESHSNKEITDIFAEKLMQLKKKFVLLEKNKENSHHDKASGDYELPPRESLFVFKELRPHFLKDDPLKKQIKLN